MLHHIIFITTCAQNVLIQHERDSPTARSIAADPERLIHCWCVISVRRRTILKRVCLLLNM